MVVLKPDLQIVEIQQFADLSVRLASSENRFFCEKRPFLPRKRGRIGLRNGLFRSLKVAKSHAHLACFAKKRGFAADEKWQTREPETDFPNKKGGFSESRPLPYEAHKAQN